MAVSTSGVVQNDAPRWRFRTNQAGKLAAFWVVAQSQQISAGVNLRDFGLEEPALSEFEGIPR
jgi:hypothetical protein